MGDFSTEPSMEDILSSIKRIIAEEGDPGASRGRRTNAQQATPVNDSYGHDDMSVGVLELKDALRSGRGDSPELGGPPPSERPSPLHAIRAPEMAVDRPPVDAPRVATNTIAAATRPADIPEAGNAHDAIVSVQAAQASRGALDALSRLVVTPEAQPATTLDDLVRDMLRPMLRDWLDSQLPGMVEKMVAREIERITGSR
ncbi:MAG: DUF2497 domain-containing protein [Sphingomonas sp.]